MPNTSSTGTILRTAAQILNWSGLHTGDQFATNNGQLDVCAAIYRAVTGSTPNCFLTDEDMALLLIETNAVVMEAIRMVSAVLPTQPCTTEIAPGYDVPDFIEHVSNWACTAPVFSDQPPTVSEVLGVLRRAADTADNLTATLPHAA